MLRPHTHPAFREPIWTAALLLSITALLFAPQQAMEGASSGLGLCGNVIIPSLFPFLILSALAVELGLAARLERLLGPLMYPLFRVNGSCACALVLGLIGGYPIGARTAIRLYEDGLCSRDEAQRLLAFCNNSGPAFLFGVVGAGVFANGRIGIFLYLIHILSALCVGLLFRFHGRCDTSAASVPFHRSSPIRFSSAFTSAVSSALQSTLNICSFVLLFSVVLALLNHFGILSLLATGLSTLFSPLGLTATWVSKFLTGLLELSSGIWSLSGSGSLRTILPLAAFMLGWGGLSVHCQVLSFFGGSGLHMGTYLIGKALHGTLSAVFTSLFLHLFPLFPTAPHPFAETVGTVGVSNIGAVFVQSSTMALVLCFLLLLIGMAIPKKAVEKRKKNEYNREKH